MADVGWSPPVTGLVWGDWDLPVVLASTPTHCPAGSCWLCPEASAMPLQCRAPLSPVLGWALSSSVLVPSGKAGLWVWHSQVLTSCPGLPLVHTPGGFGTQQMLKFPPWFSFPHPSLLELPSQWLWTGPAQFPSLISSLRGRNQHFAIVYWDYHNLISQLSFCCPFMGVCCQGALNNLHFLSGAHVPQPQVEQLINRQAAMLAAVWLLLISATKFMQPLSHVCLFAAQRRDWLCLPSGSFHVSQDPLLTSHTGYANLLCLCFPVVRVSFFWFMLCLLPELMQYSFLSKERSWWLLCFFVCFFFLSLYE